MMYHSNTAIVLLNTKQETRKMATKKDCVQSNYSVDDLETMIIKALQANDLEYTSEASLNIGGNLTLEVHDAAEKLRFDVMHIDSAYTFDMCDNDRIYGATPEYLVTHPAEIIGSKSEVLIFLDNTFKWIGFRRLPSCPRGAACVGRASFWYEMHFRILLPCGRSDYWKAAVALDKSGKWLPVSTGGRFGVGGNKRESISLLLCASIIEDAHRRNTMLAAVRDATEIKFPVPLDAYKEVFALRDGPMNGSRRKAIMHWVAKHIRTSPKGNEHDVKKHLRGVEEFTIDGLRMRLSPNDPR